MSWLGDGNKYIVVSADSGLTYAEDIRQFISYHLSKSISDSTSHTYENIKYAYNVFTDENEMISQFLDRFHCGIGFQNIFWIFLLTPDVHSKHPIAKQCDQQIWLRAGKVISLLSLKTATYRNQISFWVHKGALSLESEQILGERIREYGPDFEAFASYVDSTERRTAQLRSNLKSCIQYNKEIVGIVPTNNTGNTLIEDFSNILIIVDLLFPRSFLILS